MSNIIASAGASVSLYRDEQLILPRPFVLEQVSSVYEVYPASYPSEYRIVNIANLLI